MENSRYGHPGIWVILLLIVAGIGCDKQASEQESAVPPITDIDANTAITSDADVIPPRIIDPNALVTKIDSGVFLCMGTFARIQLRCLDQQVGLEGLERAQTALARVDELFSTYRDDSELARVNRLAAKEALAVSPETYNLLLRAYNYSRLTDGAFDITITPLIQLWKQAAKENRLPTKPEVAAAKATAGFDKLHLAASSPPTVSFAVEGMELNVDAIAKGYAVDQALAALRQPGVIAGLVDIGGEVAGFGKNRFDKEWIIGIQKPFVGDRENPNRRNPQWKIRLFNCAVATSGNYRQYVRIEGKKYSHIINPRTGWPADLLPSVTVIAPATADADALATAISVMGHEKGIKLIESLSNTEALLVAGASDDPEIFRSSGFSKFEILE
jgi:FAD:protein FMN transferase